MAEPRFSDGMIVYMRTLRKLGWTLQEIAEEVGCTEADVYIMLKR